MPKQKHVISVLVVLAVFGVATLSTAVALRAFAPQTWTRLKLRFECPEYLVWREQGGPFEWRFSGPLGADPDRDFTVAGLDAKAIQAKFPFLMDGDTLASSSYGGRHLASLRERDPAARVFWFETNRSGGGWCFVIENGRARVDLVKG